MYNNNQYLPSRRDFLTTTALGGMVLGASLIFPSWRVFAQTSATHTNPLAIPALDKGRVEGDVTIYDLEMQNGSTEFVKGIKTSTRGVNGALLGPTLRMRDGEKIRINVKNSIGETTTLHWHGIHLPAKYDGGPHQPINDGEVWSPEFTVLQNAATFWYHPHLMGKTAEHVWQGIAGMIIVDDKTSDALPLPDNYGVDDIPLVLQDRRFDEDGSMDYRPTRHDIMDGMKGNIPLANGTLSPWFEASTRLLRIRLLNGSNASIYNLGFSDNRPFFQIATDGGLLEAPFETNKILLSPGERAEIVIDVSGGENIMLQSAPDASSGGMMGGGMMGGGSPQNFNFLEIRPANNLAASPDLPKKLATIDWLNPDQTDNSRSFMMSMPMGPLAMLGLGKSHTINGKTMKMSRIDETVKLDDTEIWEISNDSMLAHPFHVHLVQFQILSRNGAKPHPGERGLKDTVLINPDETVRVIAKFENFADPDLPYMYHCHILEHEDAGMMGQFVVV